MSTLKSREEVILDAVSDFPILLSDYYNDSSCTVCIPEVDYFRHKEVVGEVAGLLKKEVPIKNAKFTMYSDRSVCFDNVQRWYLVIALANMV